MKNQANNYNEIVMMPDGTVGTILDLIKWNYK